MSVNFNQPAHSQNMSAKSKRNERLYEPLSYLYLPFVMSEHWSKIAWCCVPCCQHVTVLVGWQRCQGDTGCTTGILNPLLNILRYQWQASTGEYAFNGRRDTSQRNSQTGHGERCGWLLSMLSFHSAFCLHRFSVWSTGHHNYSNIDDVLKMCKSVGTNPP